MTTADGRNTLLAHSAAGACSGVFTRLVCQPLDVVKIRFQVWDDDDDGGRTERARRFVVVFTFL